ncbi:MAG TPA: Rne/Rng family ribonuclease [Ilumatobacteraceae bacterium]|nr:Rne/Rng family ribonuclease [Ilumatobacteraceae bacterium]
MDNNELDLAHAAESADQAVSQPAEILAAEQPDPAADGLDGTESLGDPSVSTAARKRRRGSRGGRNRKKPQASGHAGADDEFDDDDDDGFDDDGADDGADIAADNPQVVAPVKKAAPRRKPAAAIESDVELPDRLTEGRPSPEAAEKALVRRPQIGDTRPSTVVPAIAPPGPAVVQNPKNTPRAKTPKVGGAQKSNGSGGANASPRATDADGADESGESDAAKKKRRRGGKGRTNGGGQGGRNESMPELDADVLERRRGRERNGRPVGRYLMCVQVRPTLTQVAVLEGRTLIEHYVSRPADDVSQIHGNIYVGKVQNVLPGMEAAFVDISTPKNAVLYRGDVQYDQEDIVQKHDQPRIEQMLKSKQLIVCQVTKNPIGAKGARLTQEVSLPGRFVVLIPNSKTYGISKRLPDDVRKRLRNILDRVKPAEHGLIVRTAAEHATEHELRADMTRLLDQWNIIEAKAKKAGGPALLYREPELAVRVIREEFNSEYRGIVIDDQRLFDDVHDYVNAFNPELADRVERYDADEEGLPIFERFHIHEQLHKALDRKVWLPSGGSLIIEHTEALTVIDVNTGKNVGTTNLEETVFRNNLEAAEEVAKQLRLRDIGGIVVIDFIDMEIRENRRKVVDAFRSALSRDKTRTQVFDITELGLVEMTRKRIGEGLLVNFADQCPNCEGRGVVIDAASLE